MTSEDSRFYAVDKAKKRALSWKAVPATIGGKAALAAAVLLLAAGGALASVGLSMPGLDGATDPAEETPKLMAFILAFTCIVLCPVTVACAWRRCNVRCAMRTDERMRLVAGRTLVFEYTEHRGWDQMKLVDRGVAPRFTMAPRRVAVADLDAVLVRRVGKLGEWELTGPIRMRLEEDGGEETQVGELVIGSYFGKDFDELLASYAARC